MDLSRKILMLDDASVTAPLCSYLGQQGFVCRTAETFAEGRALLFEEKFDMIVSELALPDGTADELFGRELPIVIYSANTDDDAVLRFLALGAADYIFKPCSPRVLAARIALRLPQRNNTVTCSGLSLNVSLRTAYYGGLPVKLTSSEFNILRFLMAHPGKFFPADVIYERVWNASSMQTSVVRFHISNLKKTLFAVTGKNLILSEFGLGYAFASEE